MTQFHQELKGQLSNYLEEDLRKLSDLQDVIPFDIKGW